MIRKVLIGFAIATVVVLFLLWLATGGVREIAAIARGLASPFTAEFWTGLSPTGLRLPWQPDELNIAPGLSDWDYAESGDTSVNTEEELASAEAEYEALLEQIQEAQAFGEPSPFRERVRLAQGDATQGTPSAEYLVLEASWGNSAPVSISGWSLQSALTGLRAHIPRGANAFLVGALNPQDNIQLNPGASAVVTTGQSPVGTSFRENACTGYLGSLQTFSPSLSRNCPPPSESLPLTAANLQAYGDACYDFVQTLPPCYFPQEVPANISASCHIFLANNLSYNGCVQRYQGRSDFRRDSWRIYLNAGGELWRNTHDVIRLLDAEGRTVDYITY